MGLHGQHLRHAVDLAVQIEVRILEFELTRFDFGEIENVVDNG